MDIKRILFGSPCAPDCPITEDDRRWAENKILWLIKQFGEERIAEAATILPTAEYFPERCEETEEYGRTVFKRVCDYMGVKADPIELIFYSDARKPSKCGGVPGGKPSKHDFTSGLYSAEDGHYRIGIETGNLSDPVSLIATMAHELAHYLLLADKKLSPEDEDHEPITDILTIISGLGVFTANSAFKFEQWDGGMMHGWSAKKLGYLPEQMLGYILACYAFLRNERKPRWKNKVEYNVRVYMNKSLNYIFMTGNTELKPVIRN